MKKIALLLCAILVLCFSFALISCQCEHEYGEWSVTTEATCSTAGEKVRVCTKCQESEKDTIPVLTEGGHSYGAWETVLEPTCSVEGRKEKTCSLCEDKSSAIIPTLTEGGHSYGEWIIIIDPTCSAEGQRAKYCEDCKSPAFETLSPVDDQGHSYGEWYVVTDSTCSAEGEKMRDCIYCDEKETGVVPVKTTGGHSFGDWEIETEPTCSTEGERKKQCSLCQSWEYESLDPVDEGGHSFGQWTTVKDATCDAEGEKSRECGLCGDIETDIIERLPVVYTITANIDGVETVVNVPESGAYKLTEPIKIGYAFTGWTDDAASFPAAGVITENKSITANFEILPTKTFNELKSRIEGGADKILISENITLADTIYVIGEVEIYTLGNYTLTRDASFTKDLFVLGEDANGDSSILSGSFAKVTIKPSEGATLTIDGNKSNLTDTVVGTAFFMTSGSTLNIYDGVTLQNHKKLGNEKIFNLKYGLGESELIGGSVAIINDGTFNLYGGEIKNNEVNPYYSSFIDEENKVEGYKNSSYGAVIYNVGAVNVYGGTISQNLASYGGFIYNAREFNIEAGTIENNTATAYGGVVFSANTGSAITYIGSSEGDITESKVFINNNVAKGGGALYMLYNASTVIYGNVVFDGNKAEVSYDGKETLGLNGGAICSAGELVIFYAEFKNNHATYYGGAIHTSYTAEDKVPRVTLIHDVKFDSNTAKGGGAIMASGSKITLNNVTAINNSSTSKGGGFAYLSDGELVILDGEIKGSSSTSSGGAFYLSGSKLSLTGSSTILVSDNTTSGNGGAICAYVQTDEIVTGQDSDGNDIIITESTRSTVNISNVEFKNNTSTTSSPYGGGAIYISNSDCEIANSKFDGNSAIYGGAISLFSSAALVGSDIEFVNNTASANGGVMYTSKSSVELTDITVSGNKATGYTKITNVVDETTGEPTGETTEEVISGKGGAFYINSTSTFKGTNIVASENTAGNGGFMYSGYSEIVIDGESSFVSNSATSTASQAGGGAFYLSECTGSIKDATFSKNTAANGGAVSIFKSEGFTFNSCTFDSNTVTSTGGTFYLNISAVTIDGCTVTNSDADGNGGIIYSTTCNPVAISNSTFENNGGAQGLIYLTKSTFTSTNDKYLNNTSKYGTYYVNSGSNLTINNGTMNGNTANLGPCVYLKYGNLTIDGLTASNNTATKGNGGAINIGSNEDVISQVTISNATFDKNKVTLDSSESCGGAVSISGGANVTMTDVVFTNNQAVSGGGAVALISGNLTINGITATGNNTTGYTDGTSKKGGGGGALNIGAGSFTLGQGTTITKNTFTGNVAQSAGGAIYCYNTETVFTMGDVTFTNNVASTNYAGALYLRGANITVDIGNIVAEGNTAAAGNGGAIYLYAFKNGTIDSLVANNNSAKTGGVIYIAGSCSVTFGEMSGSGNSATGSSVGGYAYIGTSTVKILSGTIGENEDATGYAFHLGVNVTIDASKFTYPEGSADAPSKFVAITE